MMERFFRLSDNKSSLRTELLAGVTTFLTMAYIVFVQPAVLSGKMFGADTGMDFGAVTTATCVSAALATAIMALYARYPIAQAPGMGENFSLFFRRFQRQPQPDLRTVGRSRSAVCSCPACSS
jgi:adenine/guanine/hypoxanthine permease